jgi:predicted nuclease with TOPRIM domain
MYDSDSAAGQIIIGVIVMVLGTGAVKCVYDDHLEREELRARRIAELTSEVKSLEDDLRPLHHEKARLDAIKSKADAARSLEQKQQARADELNKTRVEIQNLNREVFDELPTRLLQ